MNYILLKVQYCLLQKLYLCVTVKVLHVTSAVLHVTFIVLLVTSIVLQLRITSTVPGQLMFTLCNFSRSITKLKVCIIPTAFF
jgi:hypothetical protein